MDHVLGHGRCGVCGHVGTFTESSSPTRENYRCERCGASLRYRLQAQAITATAGVPDLSLAELVDSGELAGKAIYEPGISGPLRPVLRPLAGYVRSAYWPDVAPAEERDGVRCEDLHRLTFADSSFAYVISSDIFEHVRHPNVAFAEIYRVLQPGGWHVFTVPLNWPLASRTEARVDTSTDEDVLIHPARYHHSPTDPNGALVYTDFGMDLPEELRELGFDTVVYHGYRSAVTFASRKPLAAA